MINKLIQTLSLARKFTIKLAVAVVLTAAVVSNVEAGIIVSNLTAATQVVYSGRVRVSQIQVFGATANDIRLTDSLYSTNQYSQPAYVRSTNVTICVTNFYTNGIFVYPTATNYLYQTNYDCGNYRTNISVSAAVVTYPVQVGAAVVAGNMTTVAPIDLVFTRGISISATNNATIIIYTQD